ncbi:hypothetical protein [Cellvibrio japonicus]|uniref:Uncharacterized protein n=1 Tax=Cellvibrio japonicus (strain Ueda107) TaxID=498211 RepID=B3PJ13_CELJU|nr:hypothetical protein [Cellvibrio japonicus]ACE84424.1 hypothetical protein CJA_0524 [Cellvibrio japonicus Ueda107]QEI11215.1 hypothetical protein FY117_02515 [Cellvibrio japonicus]QEI14789.1 hypothetical protein FY116_02515 [Cellvibrio japonicus]QEI18369.1 hypothetical protein FY115_02515 [Cellvibrio japonicus]
MSSPEFDIIFRGDIVIGHQVADVKNKLQQLFKTDAARVDALFTGRPLPLKRNLDEVSAHKYREILLKAGALVEVVAAGKFAPPTAPLRPASPAAAAPVKTGWTLAPVGTHLLEPSQRRLIQPLAVDTSHLSLRAQAGNLVDQAEVQPEPIAEVIIPALAVADLGADLLDADEKWELPLPEIELEDWGIAPPGIDLLTEDERTVVVPVVVDVSNIQLAPAGSDLGQLKSQQPPVNPDISHLTLVDNG